MKRFYFFLLLAAVIIPVQAQRGSVTGIVADSNSGTPIPYATVSLLQEGLLTNNGSVSDEEGRFKLMHVSYGEYQLVISFIGYAADTISGIEIMRTNPDPDLGQVRISPVEIELEGAEITARANTLSTSIDRKSYRAQDFSTAGGGTAADLLNKIPSVSVSPDGEVSVRGTSDFMVYLNGKPTQLDPSVLLAQLSSDMIEKVELISVPSARFDAQGKGGIVNIALKSSGPEGLNLSATALGGGAPWGHKTDRYSGFELNDYRYNTSLSLNYSKDKLNIYGSFNSSLKNVNGRRVGDARILDPVSGAFKHMVASGERPEWYKNSSGNIGIGYAFSERTSLSASWFTGRREEGRSAFYVYEVFFADAEKNPLPLVPTNEQWIYNPNTDTRYGLFNSGNLDINHKFNESSSINISGLYERSGLSRELDNFNYSYDPEIDLQGAMLEHYQQSDDTPLSGYRFALDYVNTFDGEQKLELGFQPQFFNISGGFSYDTLNPIDGMLLDYSSLENSIDLNRFVYAAYINYSSSLGKLEYMAGLRAEYTDQAMNIGNPDYFSIFDRPSESRYEVNQLDWFPSALATYAIGDDKLLFAASRRISRPPIKDMAPFLYRRHFEVYVVGDPALKPEYSNSVELSYDKSLGKNNVLLTGFYRGVDNAVFRVNTVYYDELVLIRSYTNSGDTRALGAELNSNISLGKRAKLFLGASLYDFRVRGEVFGYAENNSSLNWSLKGTVNYSVSKSLKWTADFDMKSATVTAQGNNEMFYFLNTALNYSPIRMKNWSFNLKGLDLLASNIQGLDTRAYNQSEEQIFYQETTYYRVGPIVEIGLSYSFNSGSRSIKAAKSEFGTKEF